MEDLHWRAFYTDGSCASQVDASGVRVNTYADIERNRLDAFGLFRGNTPLILVDFRDDTNGDMTIGPKRLIWRTRHLQSANGTKVKITLVGWQRKVAGRNVQAICFVNEDGAIILGGQWQNKLPLRGPIQPLPWEFDLT